MRSFARAAASLAIAGVLASSAATAGAGSPAYLPNDDGEILERLPSSPLDPAARRLRVLRSELSQRPADLDLAVRVARLYLDRGRALGDPRDYGYAQGALAPWWHDAAPPLPVLLLRATIRQHDHDFGGALADLDLALRDDPDSAEAWLARAVVLQVRGEYRDAERSCSEVLRLSTPLVAATCLAGVSSLTGAAARSDELLRNVMAKDGGADRDARVWALTTLGEIAARRGRGEEAERHFREAIAADPGDPYLLGAYADFLLDTGRAAEARELLAEAAGGDALLLRLALAEKVLGAPQAEAHVEVLRDRFAAARMRGDVVHRREEARFELHLRRDPATALRLARENWRVQREPADARILLEAALAAAEPEAAAPVVEFLARNATEDRALAPLVARVAGARR